MASGPISTSAFSKRDQSPTHWRAAGALLLAWLAVLVVNGALPFFGLPTLGQAVWVTGFSQSFANQPFIGFYAHNFGAPHPAAMAFGLPGAWIAAIFIKMGLHAADAYALMIACWLTVAFWGAYGLARFMAASPLSSALAALAWGTMPVVWNHAGYSLLSVGIALLPCYFWVALQFFTQTPQRLLPSLAAYGVACVVAIFMDGYTFMMFATGSSLLGCFLAVRKTVTPRRLLLHGACFAAAYAIFTLYIGKSQYEPADLDFFRGWGADVSFFLTPTEGVHWIPDLLGWSVPRSPEDFFGDASVWITTFSLPLVAGASIFWIFSKSQYKYPFALITLVGFYMALGPSLKFYSLKPESEASQMMEEQYAIAPTGTGVLSERIPGFKNMRASYRWSALGCLGAWALVVLALASGRKKPTAWAAAGLAAITVLNIPDLEQKFNEYHSNRLQFMAIDQDLLGGMEKSLKAGEHVAFIPWRNDFLVNYLAAKLGIIAYNIGGDKNNSDARVYWPAVLKDLPMGSAPPDLSARIIRLLAQRDADAVVLPYIDMLAAAHQWPYPATERDVLAPARKELENSGYFHITDEAYYAVVRLKPEYLAPAKARQIVQEAHEKYCIVPDCLRSTQFTQNAPTQVGNIVGGKLVTTKKSGFLHFGPYAPMRSGNYVLSIFGEVDHAGSAWMDVVGDKGSATYARFPLPAQPESSHRLLEAQLHLPEDVDDLEIRVFVEADTQMSLSGYQLLPEGRGRQP
ncbi:hypothetical protein [Acidovorax sp. M2(2025)]|uniref:hypothetical protein n=1 Tax=Acidovorax sp. M2(2025) TaxID=3411355 RepID=UPI003BF4F84A